MKLLVTILCVCVSYMSVFAQPSVSTNGTKNVLLESVHSIGVPQTPDADIMINQVKSGFSKVICAVHHTNFGSYTDAMTIAFSGPFVSAYFSGFPRGAIDRSVTPFGVGGVKVETDRGNWINAINVRLAATPTYDLTMTHIYDSSTKDLSIDVTGKALTTLSGDYYLNVYIIEDSVTGTGTQYNQRNLYNSTSGHPYFGMGDPIVGYNHNNVVRAIGYIWGTIAATNPSANSTVTKTFNYTMPVGFDANQIRLVGIVAKYNSSNINDREIQNAVEAKLSLCAPPENVQLCGVTFDETSGKNKIAWDNAGISNATSYKIYRETTTPGQYTLLTTQAATAPATYTDITSTPFAKEHVYKITLVENCASQERSLDSCIAHRTIYLTAGSAINGDINLNWNLYGGMPFTTQNIMRSLNGGAFTNIASLTTASTNYTDANPPTGNKIYRVEIPVMTTCPLITVMSNSATTSVGVNHVTAANTTYNLYPNPALETFFISNINAGDKVILFDLTGRKLTSWEGELQNRSFDVKGIAAGTYLLQVYNEAGLHKANLRLDRK